MNPHHLFPTRKISSIFPFILLILSTPAIFAQTPEETVKKFSGNTMGTAWNVTLVTDSVSITTADIQSVLDAVDARMSTWKPDSELSVINRTEDISQDIPISAEMAKVLAAALDVSRKTGGAYDITVGPLVNLWSFGPREETEPFTPPTEEEIAAAREKCGWESLEILSPEEGKFLLRRKKPGMYIDLSSIAKGYAVDQAAEMLAGRGITRFMVEAGGEVRVMGRNAKGDLWGIGIETPSIKKSALYGYVKLDNESLASSGGYRNYRKTADGKLISHIIDPRTGRPVENHVLAVSVLEENCTESDAWATAVMVLGPKGTEELAPERRVLFLTKGEHQADSETPEVLSFSQDFPIIIFSHSSAEAQGEPTVSQADGSRTTRFLLPILAVLFFFVGIGFSHFTGRRKKA